MLTVTGWRVSGFDHASTVGEADRFEGRVVLTGNGDLACDAAGRGRIDPWRTRPRGMGLRWHRYRVAVAHLDAE